MAGALGWIASLAIHGGVALVASGALPPIPAIDRMLDHVKRNDRDDDAREQSPDDPASPDALAAIPLPEPEPLRVRLGIDESDATDTDTWLGFASASPEHGGIPMGFEQAQLSRAPGEGGQPPTPVAQIATLTPSTPGGPSAPAALSQPAPGAEQSSAAQPATPAVFLAPSATPSITLARDPADAADRPRLDAPGGVPPDAGSPATPSAGIASPAPSPPSPPSASSSPAPAQAVDETAKPKDEPADLSGGAGGQRDAGALSDRDADAASIRNAILASPGRPLAAKGLRIQTVRPQFSAYSLATANPNDVVVRIWFNAQGRVAKAEIIQSSGRSDVDRPVLDAVYNWRATGEPLKALLNSDPDGRIELVFRVTLRR